VIRDPALRRRLGEAARAHVKEHHTFQAHAAAYLRLGGITPPRAAPSREAVRRAG
jgi:hypothetical protein